MAEAIESDVPKCPYCGKDRITLALEPCWSCGQRLPPFRGALPHELGGQKPDFEGSPGYFDPFLRFCGMLWLFPLAMTPVVLFMKPLVGFLLMGLAFPPLVVTLVIAYRWTKLGLKFTPRWFLVTYMKYLGIVGLWA